MSRVRDQLRDARVLLGDAKLILKDFTFGEHALGPITFEVLAAICEDPGRTTRQVAERAGVNKTAALVPLNRLQKAGLVKRVLKDKPGRNGQPLYGYRPLPEGEELYGRAHAALGGPPYRRQRAA